MKKYVRLGSIILDVRDIKRAFCNDGIPIIENQVCHPEIVIITNDCEKYRICYDNIVIRNKVFDDLYEQIESLEM